MKKEKYKILLIHPTHNLRNWKMYKERTQISISLSTRMIAAVTPDDFEVTCVDECVQDVDFNFPADLVGLTALTHDCKRAYTIAQEFRKRGIKVVMGGYHASFLPHEAKKYVDSVVVGEADYIWPKLLQDFKNGRLKPFYYNKEDFPEACFGWSLKINFLYP